MNAREIGDPAYARWLQWCNAAQDVTAPPVLLGRYPAGTVLDGEGSFQVLVEGTGLAEQPPYPGEALEQTLRSLRRRATSAIDLDRPCLLACRTGEWTWGHWLLDMLPKIVLAERVLPHRFTYAVPAGIADPALGGRYAGAVLDSLAAYGIAADRLLRVHPGAAYRCAALFDLTGVSGKHLHPGVLAALRTLPASDGPRHAMLGVFRAPPITRTLVNAASVRQALGTESGTLLDPQQAGFEAQVAAFQQADIVVGDLGSNLAAAIYARPGTGLVTLAPAGWQDDYFARLFQRLGVVQADVRGHALPAPGQALAHAPYAVNPAHVAAGLASVHQARAARPDRAWRILDGRVVAPAPGAVLAEWAFGTGGNAQPALRGGFSAPEPNGTWSLGQESRLVLSCPAGDRPLWLEIEADGFVARPHLVSRRLGISVSTHMLAEFDVDDRIHAHVLIPAGLLASGELAVTFHNPVHCSPHALGLSGDTRPLGLMLRRLALRDIGGEI